MEHTHKAVLTVNGKKLVESGDHYWTGIRSKAVSLKAGKPVKIQLDWKVYTEHREIKMRLGWETPENLLIAAKKAAAACDAAVVVTGFSKHFETEGSDRPNLELFKGQATLVRAICAANSQTAVAVINGGAISGQGWLDQAKAVVECWYPGQEGGAAIADVLTGKVNPGARLPMTFPKRLSDIPAAKWFPGTKEKVEYKEGMAVGYRHFDKAGVRPEFPFGHGLSYTQFKYSGLKVSVKAGLPEPLVQVEVSVKNVGGVAGKEVAQIYVEDVASSLPRPKKELKAFKKVALAKGQSAKLRFILKAEAFAFYHPNLKRWVVEAGAFVVHAGASVADIRASVKIAL
jgi:beta-glucosidase